MERLDSTGDNACPVCHDTLHVFAVGHCDHPVCYKCSTRMRVLCEQMDCPICRSTMPQVAFVYDRILFKDIDLRGCIPNRKNKIFYETEEIEDMYLDLLEYRCHQCPKRKEERTFAQLQTHMRREHQLFACDICLAHLKIFPYETKFYDRKSLAVHRRMGDADDKSYKGHPLCEFCDVRYLDKDELMKHLRQDHFFCHFCDQQGSNAYYNDYNDLHGHFGESHFLCTEEECGNPETRFTHAFSSDIDLKSHKATVHNKKSRDSRTIEVDFQFAPRHQGYNRRGGGINSDDYADSGTQRHGNKGDRYGNRRRQHQDDPNLQRALDASLQESIDAKAKAAVEERVPDPVNDFPSLSGLPASQVQQKNNPESQKKSVASSKTGAGSSRREEDFPSLGASSGGSGNSKPAISNKNYAAITHYASAESSRPVVKKEKPRESQPVSLGTVKTATKERWASQAPSVTKDAYPSLMGKSKHTPRPVDNSSSSWLQKSVVTEVPLPTSAAPTVHVITERPSETAESKLRKSAPKIRPISSENDFPSLGGGASRQEQVPVPGNISWFKKEKPNLNNKNAASKSKKERYDDEFFELPDSYYNSYEPTSEQYKPKVEPKSSASLQPSVSITKKDFPGLPKSADNKKQVKGDVKKVEPKAVDTNTGGKKSKKSKKGSLNDIAAGLMNLSTNNSKANGKKNTDENGNKSKKWSSVKDSKPDWFDNPPIVHENENMNIKEEKLQKEKEEKLKKEKEEKPKKESKAKVKSETNNSFPSHHAMSSSVQSTTAPPGFATTPFSQPQTISAPPGFSKPAPPGLTKPAFSIYDYIQPADFTNRNQVLVHNIRQYLESVEDGFNKFKAFSFQFRQGNISASSYYTNCQLLIGDSDFKSIFPELLALLPDINKQQDLWFEHQVVISNRPSAKNNSKNLSPCGKCGQILLKEDLQHHRLQHGGDVKDFPSLGGSSNNGATDHNANFSLKGSWIKATT